MPFLRHRTTTDRRSLADLTPRWRDRICSFACGSFERVFQSFCRRRMRGFDAVPRASGGPWVDAIATHGPPRVPRAQILPELPSASDGAAEAPANCSYHRRGEGGWWCVRWEHVFWKKPSDGSAHAISSFLCPRLIAKKERLIACIAALCVCPASAVAAQPAVPCRRAFFLRPGCGKRQQSVLGTVID